MASNTNRTQVKVAMVSETAELKKEHSLAISASNAAAEARLQAMHRDVLRQADEAAERRLRQELSKHR